MFFRIKDREHTLFLYVDIELDNNNDDISVMNTKQTIILQKHLVQNILHTCEWL